MGLPSFVRWTMLFALGSAVGFANAARAYQKTPSPAANVETVRSIQGNWRGTLNSQVGKLRLVLKVSKAADGTLKATMDSPDQRAPDLAVDTITLKDSYVHFEMDAIGASFNGGLSRDGSEIAGEFRQGLPAPLVLKREENGAEPKPPTALGLTKGKINVEPCNASNLTKDALCGKYEVFEDRTAKAGRKIALNILILPALAAKPAPDPVFVIAGGPGQGAANVAKTAGDYLILLRRERDVVFIDQRGTGESNPLNCTRAGNKDEMSGYFAQASNLDSVRECRAQLEKNANLTQYTTSIAMDDLDEVRAALGYDRINLHGGSYGTFAALVYMRQHGDRVRAAILEGVSPVEAKIYLPFAKGVEHSLERVFSDCAADKECNAAFPNLRAELKELAAKLEKKPATFESTNPVTGKREMVTLSKDVFAEQVRTLLYIPIYWRWLPVLIHEANKENLGPFASIAYRNIRGIGDQLATGMSFSVVCAEDVPFITEDEIKQSTAGTFYGDYRIRTAMRACEQWPKGKVAPSFNQPVKSNIPVLMICGDLDPVAPPWAAAGAARFLPNSRQITIPNTGHYFRFQCVDDLSAEFIEKGSAKSLDDSCVKEIERPPFVTKLPPQLAK
jgi:pimeloyl-ACP methyl ester carboxylesterase